MIKVAAYCRVSTDHEDQQNSLISQKRYFSEYITRNADIWEFYKLYVDEGVTGTSIQKRNGFKEMLADAEKKCFDILLTKEISRFARNTLDSVTYTRKLKELGISVIFLNDNINTMDKDSELRLTIMSSIAQEESRKTSQRVQWGIKRKMETGYVLGKHVYGYYLKNGQLTINKNEEVVVRKIFDMYLAGLGVSKICKNLENLGILSPAGLTRWKNSSIMKILTNEKYAGDLKQRKSITPNYLTHKSITNDGTEDFIIQLNHHDAIISREFFDKVQCEIQRRKKLETPEEKKKYSNQYGFSCKLVCGLCGASMYRKYWNGKHQQSNAVWQCKNNIRYGSKKINSYGEEAGCDGKGIHETVLQEAFLNAFNTVFSNKKQVISELQQEVEKVIMENSSYSEQIKQFQAQRKKIEVKKMKFMELYADGQITRQEFTEINDCYRNQIETLEKQLYEIKEQEKMCENLEKRLSIVKTKIKNLVLLQEYSEEVCKQVLSKAIIYSRDNISFFLSLNDEVTYFSQIIIPVLSAKQGPGGGSLQNGINHRLSRANPSKKRPLITENDTGSQNLHTMKNEKRCRIFCIA